MILFVQEGCRFCDKFLRVPGLVKATVVQTQQGPKMDVMIEGKLQRLEMPVGVPGLPALLDGEKMYVGMTKVEERLGVQL